MNWDFDNVKQSFIDRLSLLSNWATTLFYGTYDRLADATSYIVAKLAHLAEIYYRESSWENAQHLKSLTTKAKFINYTPYRKIGASGNVEVSADSNLSDSYTYSGYGVTIPMWTQMSNEDEDVKVYTTEEAIYYNGTVGNLTIPVKEGEVREFTYVANGINNEIIYLTNDSIENEYIQVDIVDSEGTVLENVNICGEGTNPEKLRFVQDLTVYYVEIRSSYTFEQVEIQFGDDVYGKKLPAGTNVKITYAITEGAEGNITQTGVITTINDTLYDSYSNEVTLYVQNDEEISNGNDAETIDHIRAYGNRTFSTGYRCGGETDWLTLLENHAYIYKAQVANMDDIGSVDPADQNKVFVTAISTDGSTLTTSQKATITTYLKDENLKSVTEVVSWRDPTIMFLLWKITAKVENQPFGVITQLIKDDLDSEYGILNMDFQQNIYESNYINFIDDIQYVTYHDTEVLYQEYDMVINQTDHELEISYTSADTAVAEDQIYLTPDTAEIWLHRKISGTWGTPFKIAEDQSGTWVGLQGDLGAGTYVISNSSLNYSTNEISFLIDTINLDPVTYGIRNPGAGDDTGYVVSLCYKCQDGNGEQLNHLRLPENDYIFDINPEYCFTTLSYV